MTRCRNAKRRTSKKKEYYRSHKTANRAKDIDQIQDELKKEKDTGAKIAFEIDDDFLPEILRRKGLNQPITHWYWFQQT
jgi:hypothetical protein